MSAKVLVTKKERALLCAPEIQDRIRKEAYTNYENRTKMRLNGNPESDWAVAESVVLAELRRNKAL